MSGAKERGSRWIARAIPKHTAVVCPLNARAASSSCSSAQARVAAVSLAHHVVVGVDRHQVGSGSRAPQVVLVMGVVLLHQRLCRVGLLLLLHVDHHSVSGRSR